MPTLTIDCDGCIMQGTDACTDCVVTFICTKDPDDAVVFDVNEERALRLLGRSGLVPPLRYQEAAMERSAVRLEVVVGQAVGGRAARVPLPSGASMVALAEELRRQGRRTGLAAVGFAPATPMEGTRRALEERRAAGLAAGMQFTYRNPARSSDPSRVLPGAAALVVGAWSYARTSTRPQAARA